MAKFKCLDCSQFFDGDMATMQCPHCSSTNFKKAGPAIPWKIIGIGGAVIAAVIILVALLGGSDNPIASMQEKGGQVLDIEVKNVKESKLRSDYKIVVYDETNSIHQTLNFNGKTNLIRYDISYMLSGTCYNFALERKDGKRIEDLKWETSTQ